MIDRPLSTLELTALGIVLKRGPCLAHAVLSEFSHSLTFAYRSGAGSIYPLLKRLHQAGLMACEAKHYTITEQGVEALREWVSPPLDPSAFSSNLDTLRSRAYFLRLLSPEQVDRFTVEAVEGLNALLQKCQEGLEGYRQSGDKFSELAMLGAVRETEARIAWLQEVRIAVTTDA